MSILKNFVNPWESSGALGSEVLETNVLEDNAILSNNTFPSNDIAVKRHNIGKGNYLFLFSRKINGMKEVYSKQRLESGNKMWDYSVAHYTLYSGLNVLKEYKKKYPKILFQNLVILTHGNACKINIAESSNGNLTGRHVEDYINGDLKVATHAYKMMKVYDWISTRMVDGGNILFLGCSIGDKGKEEDGDIGLSLGNFFASKNKILNLFFNEDLTNLQLINHRLLSIPWNKGLSKGNTGWRLIRSELENGKSQETKLEKDLALFKTSKFKKYPYYDVIRPV